MKPTERERLTRWAPRYQINLAVIVRIANLLCIRLCKKWPWRLVMPKPVVLFNCLPSVLVVFNDRNMTEPALLNAEG